MRTISGTFQKYHRKIILTATLIKTTGAIILVCVIGCFALTTLLGIPSGITPLFCVVAGGICSHLIYKKGKKAETKA